MCQTHLKLTGLKRMWFKEILWLKHVYDIYLAVHAVHSIVLALCFLMVSFEPVDLSLICSIIGVGMPHNMIYVGCTGN